MKQPEVPVMDQLTLAKKKRAVLEREVSRLQRELDLVSGKSEGKIQSLEENLERANLTISQLRNELTASTAQKGKAESELHLLQDNIIDQANEICALKHQYKLIDQELARKDKDAQVLLATMRRYKTRIEYMRSKMKKLNSRASAAESEANGSMMNASIEDESPYNASSVAGVNSSTNGARRDSIPFPGYMTAEEEYFRLVLLASKLNVAGTCTPSTVGDDGTGSETSGLEEVREQEFDPKMIYEQVLVEKVPFHKWHEWTQEYIQSHHMPALMGVDNSYVSVNGGNKKKKSGFAKKVAQGGKRLLKMIPKRKKRNSIGIAAGGYGIEV